MGEKQVGLTKTLFLGNIQCITEQHTMKTLVPKHSVHEVCLINPSARCQAYRVLFPAGLRSAFSKLKLTVWCQRAHTGQGYESLRNFYLSVYSTCSKQDCFLQAIPILNAIILAIQMECKTHRNAKSSDNIKY